MKKIFFALTATLLLPASMMAETFLTKPIGSKYETIKTRGEEALIYSYCREMSTGIGVSSANVKLGGAIKIPAETAKLWGDARISGIRVSITGQGREGTVFVTNQLGGSSIYSQNARLASGWTEITFDSEVPVPSSDFYVGYEITTLSADDFPISLDGVASTSPYSGFIGLNGQWQNYASQYGAVGVQLIVTGDNLPANNITLVDPPVLSTYVGVDSPFSVDAFVINNGWQPIENLTVEATVNGEACSPTVNFSKASIAPGESATITIGNLISTAKGNDIPVEINVAMVNGEKDDDPSDNILSGKTTCITEAFPKMFVVEEWTGTWCGYCPFGIVGMEYMAKNYGNDRFIGIAIHGGQANEPMLTTSYNSLLNKYASGFPGCIINRENSLQTQPNQEALEYYYNSLANASTFNQVTIKDLVYSEESKQIAVDAEAVFSIAQPKSNYRLAFVLTEDHVGPYSQTNYYAGGSLGAMGGWENKGSRVEWYYDEVARYINTCLGIENSLPSDIEEDGRYQYSATLPTTNVQDINNCTVIALLINYRTGAIVNATKAKIGDIANVSTVIDETAPCAVYPVAGGIEIKGDFSVCSVYDLTGKKVAEETGKQMISLPAGLYVVAVKSNDKIYQFKIMVK